MARINITRVMLRSADIILSTTGAFVSGFIRTTTGSDISHAALYAGQNNVIESIKEGVKEHPISEAYSDARLVIVLRRRNMTGLQRKNVIAQARKFMNRPYDVLGAIGSGTTNKRGAIILTGLTISLLEVTGFAGIASLINNNAIDASNLRVGCFHSRLVDAETMPPASPPLNVKCRFYFG